MALFRYVIIFSPNAFGHCNEGDTTLLSIEINEVSQSGIEALRLATNPCTFLNTDGIDVGPAGSSVSVTINAQIDTAAPGNRDFRFFLCSGGRQYNGPIVSPKNDSNGSITLKATYTVGSKVAGGDCVAFLKNKIDDKADNKEMALSTKANMPKVIANLELSNKEQTKRIIKQILGK